MHTRSVRALRGSAATLIRRPVATSCVLLTAISALLTAPRAEAADYFWDPGLLGSGSGSGGMGLWNTTSTNWLTGATDVAWPNTNAHRAVFAGTGDLVTVDTGVTSGRILFQSSNYTLSGTNILTLSGTNAGFDLAAGVTATVDVLVSSTGGTQNNAIIAGAGSTINFNKAYSVGGKTVITGAGTVNINAGGALQTGANEYTEISGGVTLNFNGGTTSVGSGGAAAWFVNGGSTISVNPGATVNMVTNTRFSVGGSYNGNGAGSAGTLNVAGGTLDFGVTTGSFIVGYAASGTYTATVNLDAGTLALNRAITKGTAGTAVFNFNGGTLKANGTALSMTGLTTANVRNGGAIIDSNSFNVTLAQSLAHSNLGTDNAIDGGLTKKGTGTLTLTGTNTYTGKTTVLGGTLVAQTPGALAGYATPGQVVVNAGATLGVNVGGAAQWNSTQLDTLLGNANLANGARVGLDTTGGAFTHASNLTGNFGLVKSGTNTLTLSGANTYSGGTTVATGTLTTTAPGALPGYNTPGQVTVNAGATLTAAVGGSGQWTSVDISTLAANGGFATGSALGFDTTGGDFTHASNLAGAFGVTKTGANTLILSGANTYSGATVITGGTLAIGASNHLGDASATNTISLGGTLRSTGGTYDLGVNRTVALTANSTLTVDSGTLTVSGRVTGNRDLTVNGAGTLALTGGTNAARSQFAQIFANTGLNITGYLDTTSKFVSLNNSTVNWNATGNHTGSYVGVADGSNATMNITGGVFNASPTSGTFIGNNSVGVLNITGGSMIVGSNTQIQLGNGYNGAGGLGSGTLNLSTGGLFSTGTTTGAFVLGSSGTNVGTGTINLDAGGTLASNRSITKGASFNSSATLNFNGGILQATGNNLALNGLTAANVRDGGAVIHTNGFNITLAQAFTHSNVNGDSATDGGLTKTGAGTLTLTNMNHTYNGLTRVQEGTLLVNGSLFGTTTIVASGAAVGGTGILSDVTVNGNGFLLGGDGTSAYSGLTIAGGVQMGDHSLIGLTLGTSGSHSSLFRADGVWEFDSNQAFFFSWEGLPEIGTYDNIITGLTGQEIGLGTIGTWQIHNAGVTGTFVYDNTGSVDLVLTAVPEPSTVAVMLSGLGLLAGMRRRRAASR